MAGLSHRRRRAIVSVQGNNSARVPGIDRVRAFAALSVMLGHTSGPYLPELFRYIFTGQPAVFVFFVISGFCIHYPYINSPLPLAAFYGSRLVRILPLVIGAVFLARLSGHPDLTGFTLRGGYVLWSVVCELWYYLLYPGFYFLARYIPWRIRWIAAFAVYAVAIYWRPGDQWGNLHYAYAWDSMWVIGLPAWLTGCVLAQELASIERLAARVSRRWLWRMAAGLSASVLCWLSWHSPLKYHYTMNVFALLAALWLAAEIGFARGEQARDIWDWLGSWSYSIYVFHEVGRVYLQMAGISNWIILPLILVACYFAYLLVELPSHRLARQVFRKLRGKFEVRNQLAVGAT